MSTMVGKFSAVLACRNIEFITNILRYFWCLLLSLNKSIKNANPNPNLNTNTNLYSNPNPKP